MEIGLKIDYILAQCPRNIIIPSADNFQRRSFIFHFLCSLYLNLTLFRLLFYVLICTLICYRSANASGVIKVHTYILLTYLLMKNVKELWEVSMG